MGRQGQGNTLAQWEAAETLVDLLDALEEVASVLVDILGAKAVHMVGVEPIVRRSARRMLIGAALILLLTGLRISLIANSSRYPHMPFPHTQVQYNTIQNDQKTAKRSLECSLTIYFSI